MERIRLRSPFLPPVLISESANEQAEIRKALEQEIKPINSIEKMYVDDIGSYPIAERFINQYGPALPGYWFETLEPYLHQQWTNNLYRCPAYRLRTAPVPHMAIMPPPGPFGSYGYNGSVYFPLGRWSLGFPANPSDLNTPASGPGVKQNAVRAPSNMIATGDSQLVVIAPEVVGSHNLTYGGWGYNGNGPEPSPTLRNKVDTEINLRHNSNHNIGFCDSHVEAIKVKKLFADEDPIRRRWCYDNEPHFRP